LLKGALPLFEQGEKWVGGQQRESLGRGPSYTVAGAEIVESEWQQRLTAQPLVVRKRDPWALLLLLLPDPPGGGVPLKSK